MTTQITPVDDDRKDERKRKRAAIVKFSLAGAALVGMAAAATSAAWTDDAWFKASATSVDPETAIDLRGLYVADGATPDSDDFDAPTDEDPRDAGNTDFVTVPPEAFENLTAGDSISVPVWLNNSGTSDLVIASPTVIAAGELFADNGATATITGAPATLAAGSAPVAATLTIALAADASSSFGGLDGSVVVKFQGSIANRD